VISWREGIKADAVHHLSVDSAFEKGVIKRASERITRVQLKQIFGSCNRFEHGCLTRKAAQFDLRGDTIKR
jgi:hypothetical protein